MTQASPPEESADLRIGSLLALSGLVRASDLQEALTIATQTQMPVGRVLVMSNRLSEEALRAVVEVQSLVKDRVLTREQALDCVEQARKTNKPLIDVLHEQGLHQPQRPTNRLGELLVDCGQISHDQLERALKMGGATGLPLGRVLVLFGLITEPLAARALQIQDEIRKGQCSRSEGLMTFRMDRMRMQGLKSKDKDKTYKIKLGELFVAAEVLSTSDVDAALEMAWANNKMLGEILTELDWISPEMLLGALKLQQKLWSGEIDLDRAVNVVKDMYSTGVSFDLSWGRFGQTSDPLEKKLTLFEFLKVAGFMTRRRLTELIESCITNGDLLDRVMENAGITDYEDADLMRKAIKTAVTDSYLLRDILAESGIMELEAVQASESLVSLVQEGALPLERAIMAFTYCHDQRIPATEAIAQLGFPAK